MWTFHFMQLITNLLDYFIKLTDLDFLFFHLELYLMNKKYQKVYNIVIYVVSTKKLWWAFFDWWYFTFLKINMEFTPELVSQISLHARVMQFSIVISFMMIFIKLCIIFYFSFICIKLSYLNYYNLVILYIFLVKSSNIIALFIIDLIIILISNNMYYYHIF